MNKIEVAVIAEHGQATEMMTFLARLTQRGHAIKSMQDLKDLQEKPASEQLIRSMLKMENHSTIKRFTPITVAIVGASRRFLAQARTHQVGMTYVSASLQYSDYSDNADFVVPYALLEADEDEKQTYLENTPYTHEVPKELCHLHTDRYLDSCKASMHAYRDLAEVADNDTAGYVAPQGLRNILIIQGNHESWMHFIKLRSCNRNTNETQYVTLRIWEELLKTDGGKEMFEWAGPDCMYGPCREGKMCCANPMKGFADLAKTIDSPSLPRLIIEDKWPLLK